MPERSKKLHAIRTPSTTLRLSIPRVVLTLNNSQDLRSTQGPPRGGEGVGKVHTVGRKCTVCHQHGHHRAECPAVAH
jgi:hypothetical protein